ncbi:hypothetical protein PVA45_07470 (plasmid) [Entomospira entomophila]|uniref:Uncharacterized protein n=1 Tax=Entomospira entomophila TaxID=2719988 RepID=A0A968GAX6_9SPIO|nr:hypothetical protein [Entomospira entomophilus]NIZ41301.1 hypothetical protein [Entomospira entomophilus]WDI36176.1 hypothetical protein PVA45_07470 [Entomospira entomophilus]
MIKSILPHIYAKTTTDKVLNAVSVLFAVIFLLTLHPLPKIPSQNPVIRESASAQNPPVDVSRYIPAPSIANYFKDRIQFEPNSPDVYHLKRKEQVSFKTNQAIISITNITYRSDPDNPTERSQIFIQYRIENIRAIIDQEDGDMYIDDNPILIVRSLDEEAEAMQHHIPSMSRSIRPGDILSNTAIISVENSSEDYYFLFRSPHFPGIDTMGNGSIASSSNEVPYLRLFVEKDDIPLRSEDIPREIFHFMDLRMVIASFNTDVTHVYSSNNMYVYHVKPDSRSFVVGNAKFTFESFEQEQIRENLISLRFRFKVSNVEPKTLLVKKKRRYKPAYDPDNVKLFNFYDMAGVLTHADPNPDYTTGMLYLNKGQSVDASVTYQVFPTSAGYYLKIFVESDWFEVSDEESYGSVYFFFQPKDFLS